MSSRYGCFRLVMLFLVMWSTMWLETGFFFKSASIKKNRDYKALIHCLILWSFDICRYDVPTTGKVSVDGKFKISSFSWPTLMNDTDLFRLNDVSNVLSLPPSCIYQNGVDITRWYFYSYLLSRYIIIGQFTLRTLRAICSWIWGMTSSMTAEKEVNLGVPLDTSFSLAFMAASKSSWLGTPTLYSGDKWFFLGWFGGCSGGILPKKA